ncbi:unnamed protein product, partial [Phaeothamnion confervicola]
MIVLLGPNRESAHNFPLQNVKRSRIGGAAAATPSASAPYLLPEYGGAGSDSARSFLRRRCASTTGVPLFEGSTRLGELAATAETRMAPRSPTAATGKRAATAASTDTAAPVRFPLPQSSFRVGTYNASVDSGARGGGGRGNQEEEDDLSPDERSRRRLAAFLAIDAAAVATRATRTSTGPRTMAAAPNT